MGTNIFDELRKCLYIMGMACLTLTLGACSDDDDDDDSSDDSSISTDDFTPGGQFNTNSGTVYLTEAVELEFTYSGGVLTSVYDPKHFEEDETFAVTHDPLTFTGNYCQLTDISQNSAGFITSLTKNCDDDGDYTVTSFTFSYDSSGHLTDIAATITGDYEETLSWDLTWDDGLLTDVYIEYVDSYYTDGYPIAGQDFEYSSDYPNVTLQYGPYIEWLCDSEENGLEMLFYLGYLGIAPSYHPVSFIGVEDNYYYDLMYYTPVLNSDGSLKRVTRTYEDSNSSTTYTFQYE